MGLRTIPFAIVWCIAWTSGAFAEGATFSAVVGSTGNKVRGTEVTSSSRQALGKYLVTFKRVVGSCAVVASARGPVGGQVSVNQPSDPRSIQVFTFNRIGAAADIGFALMVNCEAGVTPLIGNLVITEVMANPAGVSDTQGEWFELANSTQQTLNLKGMIISNASASHTIASDVPIPPGGFAVLGLAANRAVNGGVPVDYVYSGITLVNSGGSLTIRRGSTVYDAVNFTGTSWTNGRALGLVPTAQDPVANDSLANWCFNTTDPYSATDFGTPGRTNPSCL